MRFDVSLLAAQAALHAAGYETELRDPQYRPPYLIVRRELAPNTFVMDGYLVASISDYRADTCLSCAAIRHNPIIIAILQCAERNRCTCPGICSCHGNNAVMQRVMLNLAEGVTLQQLAELFPITIPVVATPPQEPPTVAMPAVVGGRHKRPNAQLPKACQGWDE